VASLVLGLLWIAGLGSLLAVIFGGVAKRQIRESNGRQGGLGMATAGIVLGIVGLVGAVLWFALIAVVFNRVDTCLNNPNVSGCNVNIGNTGPFGNSGITNNSTIPGISSNSGVGGLGNTGVVSGPTVFAFF
jgi:hypothetical protein